MSKEIDIFSETDPGDTLAMYLREISCIPLLEPSQEILLGRAIQNGIMEAEETMIKANLRLVVSIAKRFQGRGVSLLDLIQSGNEGLVKKTKDFDPSRSNQFSTFIVPWIQREIMDATREQGGEVRMTRSMAKKVTGLGKVEKRLEQAGEEPTTEKLAKESGLSITKVEEAITFPWSAIPFDELVNNKDPEVSVCVRIENKILNEELRKNLESLLPKDEIALKLSCGLLDGVPKTLKEVGKKMGVTWERIQQREKRGLKNLREIIPEW